MNHDKNNGSCLSTACQVYRLSSLPPVGSTACQGPPALTPEHSAPDYPAEFQTCDTTGRGRPDSWKGISALLLQLAWLQGCRSWPRWATRLKASDSAPNPECKRKVTVQTQPDGAACISMHDDVAPRYPRKMLRLLRRARPWLRGLPEAESRRRIAEGAGRRSSPKPGTANRQARQNRRLNHPADQMNGCRASIASAYAQRRWRKKYRP
jgi:hypothetical protein